MKITAAVNNINTPETSKYPFIGRYKRDDLEQIVLFTAPSTGILIFSDAGSDIGYSTNNWSEHLYIPIKSVTLTQE